MKRTTTIKLGVIEPFDTPPQPRETYPWSRVKPGERFLIPRGTRAAASAAARRHGKVLRTAANPEDPKTVWVYCMGVVEPVQGPTVS